MNEISSISSNISSDIQYSDSEVASDCEVDEVKDQLQFYRNELDSSITNMKLCTDQKSSCVKENITLKTDIEFRKTKISRLVGYLDILKKDIKGTLEIIKFGTESNASHCGDSSILDMKANELQVDDSRIFEFIKRIVIELMKQRRENERLYDKIEHEAYNLRNEYYVICEKIKILENQNSILLAKHDELYKQFTISNFKEMNNSRENIIFDSPVQINKTNFDLSPQIKDHSGDESGEIQKFSTESLKHAVDKLKSGIEGIRIHLERKLDKDCSDILINTVLSNDGNKRPIKKSYKCVDEFKLLKNTRESSDSTQALTNYGIIFKNIPEKIKSEEQESHHLDEQYQDFEYTLEYRKIMDETRMQSGCDCHLDFDAQRNTINELQLTIQNIKIQMADSESQLENVRNIILLLESPDDLELSFSELPSES